MSKLQFLIPVYKAVQKILLIRDTSGRKTKVEQAMQPANTQTVTPSEAQAAQPQAVTLTPTPLAAPPAPAVVPPAVTEEPKKTPEVKTLDLATDVEKKTASLRPEHRPHAFV